jgi:hypothetical protein
LAATRQAIRAFPKSNAHASRRSVGCWVPHGPRPWLARSSPLCFLARPGRPAYRAFLAHFQRGCFAFFCLLQMGGLKPYLNAAPTPSQGHKTSKPTEGEVPPAWLVVASWWCYLIRGSSACALELPLPPLIFYRSFKE